jgi:hypothetical protein
MNNSNLINSFWLKTLLLSGVLFLVSFSSVFADSVVRTGEVVNVNQDQIVDSDFYGAATNINLSGVMNRDVSVISGRINVNGPIAEDLIAVAGDASIYGPIAQSLRFVGGQLEIADDISGNVFVIGADITILSTAVIGGDLIVYGGNVNVDGEVGGSILGSVRSININSQVGGGVDINTESLSLGDRANLLGDLSYTSDNLLSQSLNSTVVGDVVRNDPVIPNKEDFRWSWIAPVTMLLFVSLLWWILSPSSLNLLTQRSLTLNPKPFAVGLATFLALPILATLMFMSTIGLFVGLLLLSLYITALLLALISAIPLMGRLIFKIFTKKHESSITILMNLTGALVMGLLMLLGNFGIVIISIFVILSLGSITLSGIKLGSGDFQK